MAELIDIFDANFERIGTLERSLAHKLGHWHQTFHCWIAGERDGRRFVLLQLRASGKDCYPDMLDITAAGHLSAGESAVDGLRELEEELGISCDSAALKPLGIKHDVSDGQNGFRNREFAHVFLLRDNRHMQEYRLQDSEVSGLVEVSVADGLALFSGKMEKIRCSAMRIENGNAFESTRDVSLVHLVPRVDNYYLKVFIMADRMLDGMEYLSI